MSFAFCIAVWDGASGFALSAWVAVLSEELRELGIWENHTDCWEEERGGDWMIRLDPSVAE